MRTAAALSAVVMAMLLTVSLSGCDILPGRARAREQRETAPTEVATFHALYDQQCAGCHGRDGRLGAARPLNDPVYLALVSDQHLRTTVIAGRADLGMPDWRGQIAGRALSPQEVSDVVAWLVAHRTQVTGRPVARADSRASGR